MKILAASFVLATSALYLTARDPHGAPIPEKGGDSLESRLEVRPRPLQGKELAAFHAAKVADFISQDGFGLSRLVLVHANDSSEAPETVSVAGEVFRVSRHELLSLRGGTTPRAYKGNLDGAGMQHFAREETRPLTAFEASAVVAFSRGESLVAEQAPDGIQAVGALRAGEECASCHEVEVGTLLGAFSYGLVR